MGAILEIRSVEDALKIIFSYDPDAKKPAKLPVEVPEEKSIWDTFLDESDTETFNNKYPFPFGIWFRGLSRTSYDLVPSVFRKDEETGKFYKESALFNSFKLYNPSYNKTHHDNLAWLTLMQHYDLPTRLLDWSENILTGLYFAARDDKDHGLLYMLNARRLNRLTRLSASENKLAIPSSIEPQLFSLMAADNKKKELLQNIHYLNLFQKVRINNPATIHWFKGLKNKGTEDVQFKMRTAVAVFPERINARMQAQQSMFTIHGGKIMESGEENEKIGLPFSLEYLSKGLEPEKQFLHSYIIPYDCKKFIREGLRRIGIDERFLYPDIDKQAGYLKKLWQIENKVT